MTLKVFANSISVPRNGTAEYLERIFKLEICLSFSSCHISAFDIRFHKQI